MTIGSPIDYEALWLRTQVAYNEQFFKLVELRGRVEWLERAVREGGPAVRAARTLLEEALSKEGRG